MSERHDSRSAAARGAGGAAGGARTGQDVWMWRQRLHQLDLLLERHDLALGRHLRREALHGAAPS